MSTCDLSQDGEFTLIRKLLPFQRGFFVDVGAHNGIHLSNTFGLVKEGWKGVSIEPNPKVFPELEKNLSGKPIKLVQAAAYNRRDQIQFFFGKDDPDQVLATVCTENSEWFQRVRSRVFVWVQAIPLTDILSESAAPTQFELLSIDAEGADLEVLQGLDFTLYRPKLIITENYEPKNVAKAALLQSRGYKLKDATHGNTFWME